VWDKPRYERLVDQTNNSVLMNSGFIMERLDRGESIEIDAAEAQPNDIVVYFAGDQLKHAGRIIAVSGKLTIRSKWGGNEVHEHELWEVPLEHGDEVRFFRPPDPKALLDRLEAAQKPRADVRRFCYVINTDEVLGTHNGANRASPHKPEPRPKS
jgi:hypothetical protein